MLNNIDIDTIILMALKEDMALGDITTDTLIEEHTLSQAVFIAKEEGVIAGLDVSERVFKLLDPAIIFNRKVKDGDLVKRGEVLVELEGDTRVLLKGERTALNFLQRLSGIANRTREFCGKVSGLPVKVVDTRKTTPGLRYLEKYAVRMGGGSNHRFSLSDGVLIKDNHIVAAGGITPAICKARQQVPHTMKIEIETETLAQVQEALDAGADIIMLDNMDLETMGEAVKLIDKRAIVEASGDMSVERVYEVASTGVDIISVGKITHSVKAFDISMKFR